MTNALEWRWHFPGETTTAKVLPTNVLNPYLVPSTLKAVPFPVPLSLILLQEIDLNWKLPNSYWSYLQFSCCLTCRATLLESIRFSWGISGPLGSRRILYFCGSKFLPSSIIVIFRLIFSFIVYAEKTFVKHFVRWSKMFLIKFVQNVVTVVGLCLLRNLGRGRQPRWEHKTLS